MKDFKDSVAERFPEHLQTIDELLETNAAFKGLSEEYSRLMLRLDSLPSDVDPKAAAEAEALRSRIVDLDTELLALVEQNARV